ncbi:peptidoglycan-binding domain-containing protein [Streptomyces similanensis]|uniref:Peptidoglycan binding-like domain-containing protein n=1 Tax=Streptomyces similanensis TaxID=1274988 RepID=A0ABP9JUH7_9ACTN|nr:peptidoglycan-binding protein [Streptomyces seoulensis]
MGKRLVTLVTAAALILGAGVAGAGAASAAPNYLYCGRQYSSAEPELDYGDTGASVKALQCQLNENMSGPDLAIDGVFGGLTYNAVLKFQGCFNLAQDGIVGPNTWAALDAFSNIPVEAERIC